MKVREKDRHRFAKKKKFLAFAHASKTKELFNCVRLGGKYVFFLARLVLAILMLISRKLVQRRGTGEKYGFSLLAGRQQRVQLKLRDANDKFD